MLTWHVIGLHEAAVMCCDGRCKEGAFISEVDIPGGNTDMEAAAMKTSTYQQKRRERLFSSCRRSPFLCRTCWLEFKNLVLLQRSLTYVTTQMRHSKTLQK